MTMRYLQITQPDLQREYRLAQTHPRHLVPSPRALPRTSLSRADLPSVLDALDTARYVLEVFRRTLPDGSTRRLLGRIGNRLIKMIAQLRRLEPAQD